MRHSTARRQPVSAAQRGQIVQRILIDNWTSAQAAAAFTVSQRLVEIWVADYRRHGMASLRHVPRRTVAAEIVHLRLLAPLEATLHRAAAGLRGFLGPHRHPEPSLLRSSIDERSGGS